MIKAVIFDLWGVLALKKHWVFDEVKKDLGLRGASHPYFVELLARLETGALDESGFWQKFCHKYNIDTTNLHVRPWLAYYEIITQVNKPVLQLAEQLKQQGYKVAILSNTDSAAVQHLTNLGVPDMFDAAIFSCDIGALKPDKKIYMSALSELGVKPSEAIFIDDRSDNVEAAEVIGLHGIVFNNAQDTKKRIEELTR